MEGQVGTLEGKMAGGMEANRLGRVSHRSFSDTVIYVGSGDIQKSFALENLFQQILAQKWVTD